MRSKKIERLKITVENNLRSKSQRNYKLQLTYTGKVNFGSLRQFTDFLDHLLFRTLDTPMKTQNTDIIYIFYEDNIWNVPKNRTLL